MIELAAPAVVTVTGLFFLLLGGASLLTPARVRGFLVGFAGSRAKHYAELALRLIVGGAFVILAPRVPFSSGFGLFGWVLLGTTAVLLLIPWRWHHRFAQRAVPEALRFLPLVGISSLALGALVLWAVWHRSAG
jgi:hypothetical protein